MPTPSALLKILKPFRNDEKIIVHDQSVGDIIGAILETHNRYKNQYDLIYPYFVGSNEEETAHNVFNFLKSNVKYNVEPEDLQTVKSPAAIIATGKSGSDCKNYALFINGVLDAYRRNENLDFSLAYRFASYEDNEKTPQHVFSVMTIDGKEIWTDPVLSFFNQKKYPYFYKDKKIKDMALVALSGFNDNFDNDYQYKKVGDATEQFVNVALSTGANAIIPGSGLIVGALASLVESVFPTSGCQGNDWQGWDNLSAKQFGNQLGFDAYGAINDILLNITNNKQCAAQNVLQWIAQHGQNGLVALTQSFNLSYLGNDRRSVYKNPLTVQDIVNAISMGGYPTQAQALQQTYLTLQQSQQSQQTNILTNPMQAGTNILLPLAAVGLLAYLFLK